MLSGLMPTIVGRTSSTCRRPGCTIETKFCRLLLSRELRFRSENLRLCFLKLIAV